MAIGIVVPSFVHLKGMPRKSLKRCIEEDLEGLVVRREWAKVCRVMFDDDTSSDDDDSSISMGQENTLLDLAVQRAYDYVSNSRYLFRGRHRKSLPVFGRDLNDDETGDQLPWLTEEEFLEKYRMRRESFHKLVSMISDHDVFGSNSVARKRPQRPPAHQLMVLLHYLGTAGSGASNNRQRNTFGLGRGTSQMYRERCVAAIRSLRDQVIHWPDEEEREEIAKRNAVNFNIPNCIAIGDGTLLPLQFEPQSQDAPDYSGRKHQYSLSVMVINDDQKRVRYYLAGHPGTAHDSRVHNATRLAKNPTAHFGSKCHMIGDSAFENSSSVVASFKAPRGHTIGQEQERFNTHLARLRMSSDPVPLDKVHPYDHNR